MDTLNVYLPEDRRLALIQGHSLPESSSGAALFADISGFTPLMEAITQALGARRGVEVLSHFLDRLYTSLFAEVEQFGGSVVSLSGDGIVCWFDDHHGISSGPERATACALALKAAMRKTALAPVPGQSSIFLELKVAVASGPVRRFLVGDPQIQVIDVLAGDTVIRMAGAEALARRGDIVVDRATLSRLGDRAQLAGWCSPEFARLAGLSGEISPAPWPRLPAGGLSEALARPWLLPPVFTRLKAGINELLAELRPVTVMFLKFEGLDFEANPLAASQLDRFVRYVQLVLQRYEGSLIQLSVGEKGSYLFAAFGAPIAHEDDPERAARAAWELHLPPAELEPIRSIQTSMARGIMYAGPYGGATRRTYGIFGDQVNLAARLMQHARPGQVIAHQGLSEALPDLDWELIPALQVKGKQLPVDAASLVGLHRAAQALPLPASAPLVGRQSELAHLEAALQRVLAGGSHFELLIGEVGVGKSRLVSELVHRARQQGMLVLQGSASSIQPHTPYYAWAGVFAGLLGLQDPAGRLRLLPESVFARAVDLAPESADRLFLLKDILGPGPPEPGPADDWDPVQRQQSLQDLLAALLRSQARTVPLLIVLEDAQWLDSLSWNVARSVAGVPGIFLLVVARPLEPSLIAELCSRPGSACLTLSPLSLPETMQLASSGLDLPADRLPAAFASLLYQRTEGNPFFTEQLVLAIREQGLLDLLAPTQPLASGSSAVLMRLSEALPEGLQSLLLNRLDRLSPPEQAVLKVAAVIGDTFDLELLDHAIQPYYAIDREQLRAVLAALQGYDLLVRRPFDSGQAYRFRHLVMQEAVYHMLPYAQRKDLHSRVAAWVEQAYHPAFGPVCALIAHHYSLAEDAPHAAHYLLRAGDSARLLDALPEAIDFYHRALTFLRQVSQAETIARTLMKLGLTYHLASRFPESRKAYEEGFSLWQQASSTVTTIPSPSQNSLRMDWPYMPTTLDPAFSQDVETDGLIDQLFSGLLDLGPEMELLPGLAQRWEVLSQGRQYLFHLDPLARWSDGQPLTAYDFVFAWQRLLSPQTASPLAPALFDLSGARRFHQGLVTDPASLGARALDPHTLFIDLEQPDSYFLYWLANKAAYAVPAHKVRDLGASWTAPGNLATSGPFVLKGWIQASDQDGYVRLARSSTYHGRFSGNLRQVELHAFPSAAGRIAAYEDDRLDVLSFRNLTLERQRLRQRYAGDYLTAPKLAITYLGFDCAHPPFADERLRRALVLSVDREAYASRQMQGFAFPALGGVVPPGMSGHSPDIGLPFDPQEARSLWAISGYNEGEINNLPPIEFLAGPGQEPEMDYLAGQWQGTLGLSVHRHCLEWDDFLQRMELDRPPIYLVTWICDIPDPDFFLRGSDALRWTGWQDPGYLSVVDQARSSPDPARRLELYAQADRQLISSAVLMPFLYLRSHFLLKPWVKKFPTSAAKWWYWKDTVIELHHTDRDQEEAV